MSVHDLGTERGNDRSLSGTKYFLSRNQKEFLRLVKTSKRQNEMFELASHQEGLDTDALQERCSRRIGID